MRFFLDASMPRSAVSALTTLGHTVEFSRDIGIANDRDEAIAAHARETRAALVTRDLDFADADLFSRLIRAGGNSGVIGAVS
jgi:predicted nuclease of predicted toxin-antitoxin system